MDVRGLNLQNHLVLCGWKPEMDLIIKEILHINSLWRDEDIVIISKAAKQFLQNFKDDPELKGVHIIIDEPFSEKALAQACIQKATKVIVLADWSNKNESATETDAKTVMAAMAVEKMAPHVYMIAELLDPAFAVYLKMAFVDEIIYSREYSRILLASSVSSGGIAHVIYDLLSIHHTCKLSTLKLPSDFTGKTFGELYQYYDLQTDPRIICIGLLENTGNLAHLKRRALIEAQKHPDMRTILSHLKNIKEIESNTPKLNPGQNYSIRPNSLAIVMTHRIHTKEVPSTAIGPVPANLQMIHAEGSER